MIDLRSDTVTRPSKGMLDAMHSASVGDDVFGEDPSVITLEERTATMFGKEAGLFCPSGTMTNQIAVKVHTRPGEELICDTNAHIYCNEGGGIAFNSSVQVRLLPGDRGRITAEQVSENINPTHDWLPKTSLVSLENTVNKAGGSFYNNQEIAKIAKVCKEHKLKLHLDGARIFNALIETKETPLEAAKHFDSVSICFSKGLGCPVGSVLIGSRDFIKQSRRVRKVFGGGMRQAGFLAAAANYALDHNLERLKEDHQRAKKIGAVLQALNYVDALLPVETNIVIFSLKKPLTSEDFLRKLEEKGIKGISFGKHTVRLVTHLDFDDSQLEKVLAALPTLQ